MKNEDCKTQHEELILQNSEEYIAPNIEVLSVEAEQSFFAGSGDLPGMPGEDWWKTIISNEQIKNIYEVWKN